MKIIVTREEAHMLEDFAALLPGKIAEDMAKDIKPIKTENGYEINIAKEYIEAASDLASSSFFNFGALMMAIKAFGDKCDRIAKTLAFEKDLEEKHKVETGVAA